MEVSSWCWNRFFENEQQAHRSPATPRAKNFQKLYYLRIRSTYVNGGRMNIRPAHLNRKTEFFFYWLLGKKEGNFLSNLNSKEKIFQKWSLAHLLRWIKFIYKRKPLVGKMIFQGRGWFCSIERWSERRCHKVSCQAHEHHHFSIHSQSMQGSS